MPLSRSMFDAAARHRGGAGETLATIAFAARRQA
jgi:hypothetical protein